MCVVPSLLRRRRRGGGGGFNPRRRDTRGGIRLGPRVPKAKLVRVSRTRPSVDGAPTTRRFGLVALFASPTVISLGIVPLSTDGRGQGKAGVGPPSKSKKEQKGGAVMKEGSGGLQLGLTLTLRLRQRRQPELKRPGKTMAATTRTLRVINPGKEIQR